MSCHFVPPYLLSRLAEAGDMHCRRTLRIDRQLRSRRASGIQSTTAPTVAAGTAWVVHSADNTERLPGRLMRTAGEPATGDEAVDEAADGVSASLALFAEAFGRTSYDDRGAQVRATVHYGRDYANAFWDGSQLVFGDGDGRVFGRFTAALDVLGHEFSHAVVEHSAGLVYRDQPGALNESISDVFAACLVQRERGQSAEQADWLIGADLFLPGVQARALRDMAAPGTAYDDSRLGSDPQPAHMDDFVVTRDDNGGVHINSGIPNRAFHLAATAIGGASWEGAGRIWYDALTSPEVGPTTDFAGLAEATVAVAGPHADEVRSAWSAVGIEAGSTASAADATAPTPEPGSDAARHCVTVRRTGGVAGLVQEWTVEVDGDEPSVAEVRSLARRVDLTAIRPRGDGSPAGRPDVYVYLITVYGTGPVEVAEPDLTSELRRLVELVIEVGA